MKLRTDLVTNSSSTSYTITNKTDKDKTLVDFVEENPELIEAFVERYSWHKDEPRFTQEQLIKSAESNNIKFPKYSSRTCEFGDENGTTIGHVFDYILRSGGESESFIWEFKSSNR